MLSSPDGTFSINGTSNSNLIAEVTNYADPAFVLEAVPGKHDIISPVTTMIKNKMDMKSCDAEAMQQLIQEYLAVAP